MGQELKARGTARLRIDADNENQKVVTARANTASAYYGDQSVSASNNDGTIAAGESITLTQTRFFLTQGTHTRLFVSDVLNEPQTLSDVNALIAVHNADTTDVHGIPDTSNIEGGGGGIVGIIDANSDTYGAVGDAKRITASITSGTALLTGSPVFTADDVGKIVCVRRAGALYSPPTGLAAAAAGGGSFGGTGMAADGVTYYYKITWGAGQETTGSAEVSATPTASQKVNLSWDALPAGVKYVRVFRSTVAGSYSSGSKLVAHLGAVTSYSDLGKPCFGGTIPAANNSAAALNATILSVNGSGVATLDTNAGNTVAGERCYFGTDNWQAIQDALDDAGKNLSSSGGEVVLAAAADGSDFLPRGYMISEGLRMTNMTNVKFVGLGAPSIWYGGLEDSMVHMLSCIGCDLVGLGLKTVNEHYSGDVVTMDFADYPVFSTLAAPVDAVQTTITLTEPCPQRYAKTQNGSFGAFLSWDYDDVAHTVAAGYEGVFVDDISPDGLTLTVQRGKIGTSATTHLAGAPVAHRPGQWDVGNCWVRNCDIIGGGNTSGEYQPSLNSCVRINRAIYCGVDEGTFLRGGGGNRQFAGKETGLVILGNNSSVYKYGQANAYVNVCWVKHTVFKNGANAHVLVASGDCEAFTAHKNTHEPLSGGFAGGYRGVAGHILYGPVFSENWLGDIGASGGTWFSNLNVDGSLSRPGTIRDNMIHTPSGGDANSGTVFFLAGFWNILNNSIGAPDPTYGAYIDNAGGVFQGRIEGNYFANNAVPLFRGGNATVVEIGWNLGLPTGWYEQSAAALRQKGVPVVVATANRSLDAPDYGALVTMDNAGALTYTINAWSGWPEGCYVDIMQKGAGQVTVTPGGGVTITGDPGLKTRAQNSVIRVQRIALDTWVVHGDSAA